MPEATFDAVLRLLELRPPRTSEAVTGTSDAAPSSARRDAERALLFQAVAARGQRLADSPLETLAIHRGQARQTEAERALGELAHFARALRGLSMDELLRTSAFDLDQLAAEGPHATYRAVDVHGTLSDEQLAHWDLRLQLGQDLPLVVGEPGRPVGHLLLVSDVRADGPERTPQQLRYLVSDPLSGRTAWIPRQALADPSGHWLRESFDLAWTKILQFLVESVAPDDRTEAP